MSNCILFFLGMKFLDDILAFKFSSLYMLQVLHSTNNNKNASKALIAAEYTGVKVELAKNFEMGVSNKTPEFIKMNPIGKVCYYSTEPYILSHVLQTRFC